jgi:hypothetical protein
MSFRPSLFSMLSCIMIMKVMEIGSMRMGMDFMFMNMRMGMNRFPGVSLVKVSMVAIIMPVTMFMNKEYMMMGMAMLFGGNEPGTDRHQGKAEQNLWTGALARKREGENKTDERG